MVRERVFSALEKHSLRNKMSAICKMLISGWNKSFPNWSIFIISIFPSRCFLCVPVWQKVCLATDHKSCIMPVSGRLSRAKSFHGKSISPQCKMNWYSAGCNFILNIIDIVKLFCMRNWVDIEVCQTYLIKSDVPGKNMHERWAPYFI